MEKHIDVGRLYSNHHKEVNGSHSQRKEIRKELEDMIPQMIETIRQGLQAPDLQTRLNTAKEFMPYIMGKKKEIAITNQFTFEDYIMQKNGITNNVN
jgi:uncharacterized membrane-anchored protein